MPKGNGSHTYVRAAKALATVAHSPQQYNDGPYIEHPALVARLVPYVVEYEALPFPSKVMAEVVAWLHDTIEDNSAVTREVLTDLGFSATVVANVEALTFRKDRMSRQAYIERVRQFDIARVVKTADNAANTFLLDRLAVTDPSRASRLEDKYVQDRMWLGVHPEMMDNLLPETFDEVLTHAA